MAQPSEETITFRTDSGEVDPGQLAAVRLSSRQAISEPYEVRVELRTDVDGGLSPEAVEDMLRMPARVEIAAPNGQASSEVHGVLSEVELRSMTSPDEAYYEVVLRPRLWRTTLPFNSRVFQDMDVTQIVAAVLDEHGVPHELRCNQTYPVREYVVQYEETDFAFLSRQMEHWGIFYFFEQGPDGETMIVADSNDAFAHLEGFETIDFSAEGGDRVEEGGHVLALSRRHRVRPEKVVLEDYNWRTPTVAPEGEHDADASTGYGVQRRYGDHIKDASEGARMAQVRAEALAVDREVYTGRSTLRALAPGHRFELRGYPIGDLDQEYVVVEVEQTSGSEADAGHVHTFRAIPYATPFRAQRVTPKPRIVGFMHARVDGATPGMAAPIDEQGRYKVVMPYDAAATPGGNASRWIRMAQASSGMDYGMHFPLHIGIEIAVLHLDGDPDRPVIIGATPNPDTASPVTSADATKSRIKTKSGILIEFEDAG